MEGHICRGMSPIRWPQYSNKQKLALNLAVPLKVCIAQPGLHTCLLRARKFGPLDTTYEHGVAFEEAPSAIALIRAISVFVRVYQER